MVKKLFLITVLGLFLSTSTQAVKTPREEIGEDVSPTMSPARKPPKTFSSGREESLYFAYEDGVREGRELASKKLEEQEKKKTEKRVRRFLQEGDNVSNIAYLLEITVEEVKRIQESTSRSGSFSSGESSSQ